MIIIGDVHGYYEPLLELLDKVPGDDICFVGDLIDRGPQSYEVVKLVMEKNYKCVMGNHEYMMVEASKSVQASQHWHNNGARPTLMSYPGEKELREHLDWMSKLPLFIEFPEKIEYRNLVVSHSSVAAVWHMKDNPNSTFKDHVLWNRWPIDNVMKIFNVFGHTPQRDRPAIYHHYACIDRGGFARREPYGKLCALQFPEMKVYEVDVPDLTTKS